MDAVAQADIHNEEAEMPRRNTLMMTPDAAAEGRQLIDPAMDSMPARHAQSLETISRSPIRDWRKKRARHDCKRPLAQVDLTNLTLTKHVGFHGDVSNSLHGASLTSS
jgi:hypothetical protein